MREECKGCFGPDLPGEHMFDCPTRIRGIETRLKSAEARVVELEALAAGRLRELERKTEEAREAWKLVEAAEARVKELEGANLSRDDLGKIVRAAWVRWCIETGHGAGDPSKTCGWDDMPEPIREVDRRIGEAIVAALRGEGDCKQRPVEKAEDPRDDPITGDDSWVDDPDMGDR